MELCPTRNSPADLGSRGCELRKLCEFRWNGPEWLGDRKNWPEQPDITNTDESEKERKMEEAHLQTIQGGVTLTMTRIRDQHWIPTLRQLVKRIIKRC